MSHLDKSASSQNLQVWYCEHCQAIHFRTQNVMLDFTRKEFIELTNVILDIFQNHFDPLQIKQISESTDFNDDILMSETIS